jgi:hypothetical protein
MTFAALVFAAAMTLSQGQAPGTAPGTTVRLHHLHFRTDDFAGALTEAARAYGGTRTILQGLGPGVRVGDAYLLFERPSAGSDEKSDRRDAIAARVNAAAEWLRVRGIAVTIADAGRRIMSGGAVDAPLDHVAFADVAAIERALHDAGSEPVRRTAVSVFTETARAVLENNATPLRGEIPNAKPRIPTKLQAPSPNRLGFSWLWLGFELWDLVGIWDLELGISPASRRAIARRDAGRCADSSSSAPSAG